MFHLKPFYNAMLMRGIVPPSRPYGAGEPKRDAVEGVMR